MKYVPNILSSLRLAAAPYVFYVLWSRQWTEVLWWFVAIGITDGLDGFIARKFNAQSRLGAMLDPVADMVLLSGSFLVLALNGSIPVWLTVLVLGRDLAIVLFALGMLAFSNKRQDFPPSQAGKLSTVVQMFYILAVVMGWPLAPWAWAVVAATGWSAVDYARLAVAILRS